MTVVRSSFKFTRSTNFYETLDLGPYLQPIKGRGLQVRVGYGDMEKNNSLKHEDNIRLT